MAAEEWIRAGKVIRDRIDDLGLTVPQFAEKAQVHPSTIRALIKGERWLRATTRDRIMRALDWPSAELTRRVWGTRVALEESSTEELVRELCRRVNGDHDARDK